MAYKAPFGSAANYGVFRAGTGLNVTNGTLNVNPASALDVGYFYSTQTQLNLATINIATCDSTTLSQGVSLVGNTQFTVSKTGNYTLTYTIQVEKTAGGTAANVDFWLRKNGLDVADSNNNFTLSNNNASILAAANFTLTMNAGDYLEMCWHSASANAQLTATPAQVAPVRPLTASVSVTLLQV